MSFLRHVGIFRSDDFYAAGSERLPHSQRSSDSMSSSRLFLGRLLSSSDVCPYWGRLSEQKAQNCEKIETPWASGAEVVEAPLAKSTYQPFTSHQEFTRL